jgi:hypothetical protein
MRDSSLDQAFQRTLAFTPKNPSWNFVIPYPNPNYPAGWNGNPFMAPNRNYLHL